MSQQNIQGYLIINKPKGVTSFQCVYHIKKLLPLKTKIGHSGTLDDFATGLLIICIGQQATRFSGNIMNIKKEYIVTAKLGELTDSLDCTGTLIKTIDASMITPQDIVQSISTFDGSYEQIPPIYSALKHKGRTLYSLARNQHMTQEQLENIVHNKKRTVTIHSLHLLKFNSPFLTLQTKVSKGTYIRSLAHDIAQRLNSCATTYELTRTKIGEISVDQAHKLTNITSFKDIEKNMIHLNELPSLLGTS